MTQAPTPGPLSVGNLHTAIMEALAEDIQRQRPDAFREEDENGFEGDVIIPTGATPQSAFAKVNVSDLAEVILPLVAPTAPVEASGSERGPLGYCKPCNGPRAVSPCHKCGGELQPAAEGWEWPELPSIDRIRALAREVGYGVGVHGSLERDLDLIAIPWAEEAVSPSKLAAHIAAGLPGQVLDDVVQDKPAGRWSCNINPEGWFKMIDLSVMPPIRNHLISVVDDRGFTRLYEPNEDGGPGDLVADVWNDDYLPVLAALRPQPSGETREDAGTAELQVGRAVYERIEKLLTTNPQGWERDYLCHLVESVEEVGGYDGPRLDRRDDRQAVADFLKLRDESVGHSEVDDAERLESANAILDLLSARPLALGEGCACPKPTPRDTQGQCAACYQPITTPARAEAQDEGSARYRLVEDDDGKLQLFSGAFNVRIATFSKGVPTSQREDIVGLLNRAHPSPTPAADADRVRIAVAALEPFARLELPKKSVGNAGAYSLLHTDIRRAAEAFAVLNSTGAKEGGEG